MARSGQPGRTRSFKASYIERLIVEAVVGSQIEPAMACRGAQTNPIKADGDSLDGPTAPKSASRPSQERLGSVLGRPRNAPAASRGSPRPPQARKGAPGGIRERADATKIEAESHSGGKASNLFRAARLGSVVRALLPRVSAILTCFAESANPLKYCASQQKRRFGTGHSESSRPRDGTSKNEEKRRKS